MKAYIFNPVIILFLLAIALPALAATTCPDNFQLLNGICIPSNTGLPDPAEGVTGVISNLLTWMLGIFGFIAIVAFIISGVLYLTAAGDAEQEKTAKKAMKMAIIGVIVGLSGYVIIQAVNLALNAQTDIF